MERILERLKARRRRDEKLVLAACVLAILSTVFAMFYAFAN
jgi:hypothetical protein